MQKNRRSILYFLGAVNTTIRERQKTGRLSSELNAGLGLLQRVGHIR